MQDDDFFININSRVLLWWGIVMQACGYNFFNPLTKTK